VPAAFGYWQLYRGEFRATTPEAAMLAPFPRLLVLHVTIIIGAFLVAGTGQPIAALALLVLLKIAFDLGGQLIAHRVTWLSTADPAGVQRRTRRSK
jgi:hypothetical protein